MATRRKRVEDGAASTTGVAITTVCEISVMEWIP